MDKKLIANDMIDEADSVMKDGEPYLSAAGVLKMIATAAYHNPLGSNGRRLAEIALDKLTAAAFAKGFAKTDMLRTAFSRTCPPTPMAKKLADEMALTIGDEFFEVIADRVTE